MRKTEFPTWNSNILTPIAFSNIGIKSLVTDTTVKKSTDSSYVISTRLALSEIKFDTLIKFSEIPFKRKYTLQSLKLDPQTVSQRFSLGDFINQTPYTFINGYNGVMLPALFASLLPPTLDQGPLGPYYFNANQFFKSATLITGTLDLLITNNLPVDLQNISIQFRNQSSGVKILEESGININSGQTIPIQKNLAGKTVEGNLEALIQTITIVTNGLKTQPIDTSKSLEFKMTISNVTVSEATAIFPKQDVINENSFPEFENMNGLEIKEAVLRSGNVQIDVTSTAQDTLYFDYRIPSLTTPTGIFQTAEKVNAGSVAQPAIYTKSFDFTDYHLDLTKGRLDKDTVNKINSQLDGRIRASGKLIYLSLKDSLSVDLKIKNLVAASAKGYLGDTTIVVQGESLIDNFKKYASSIFSLEKASVKLNIYNGVGVVGELTIQELKAVNSITNQSLALSGSAVTSVYPIAKAIETPFSPVTTSIEINQSNSNITDLIALKPDKLTYKVSLKLNPLGNQHTYDDFIVRESSVKVDADVNIPLSINVENLRLTDTIKISNTSIKNVDKIQSGSFNFVIDNQFPFNAFAKIYVLNANNVVIDSLISVEPILAGVADNTGKVISKTHSVIKFPFTKSQLNNIVSSNKLLIDTKFTTESQKFVKLFSDYNMDIKLVGDFIYNIDANKAID